MAMEQRVEVQELLPGIPDDIALEHITTKIDYKSIDVLSKVNRTWNQAIQDRLIHDARVRSHSTETFYVYHRFFWGKQLVGLDGNVYSLGGHWQSHTFATRHHRNGTVHRTVGLGYAFAEVYVLDLAGCSKTWRKCASMHEARVNFTCGIKNGQILVVGGWNGHTLVDTAEVYDANNNSWSIMPTPRDWWDGFRYQFSVDV